VRVSQKASFSLLISLILFAGFTVLAYTGLFDLVEARFYNPSVTRALSRENRQDAALIQRFLGDLQDRFAAALEEPAIRRSFLSNQSGEDVFERARIFGLLRESLSGLQSVQFIDAGGSRIHYSTGEADIVRQDRLSTVYRPYGPAPEDLPYHRVAVADGGQPRLAVDEGGQRIVFALPFYDSFAVYRGTALFSLSIRALTEKLLGEGRLPAGETLSPLSSPPGLIFHLPPGAEKTLLPLIASLWRQGQLNPPGLVLAESGTTLSLISARTSQGLLIGRLADESLFSFPRSMRLLLLAAALSTLYLLVFLLFNLRQDYLTIAGERIKKLQKALLEEYNQRRGEMDWARWRRELEHRREELRQEIKEGLRLKPGGRLDREINARLDRAWREVTAIIKADTEPPALAYLDEARLQDIVDRVLRAAESRIAALNPPPPGEIERGATFSGGREKTASGELDEGAELKDNLTYTKTLGQNEMIGEVTVMKEQDTSGPPQDFLAEDIGELEELEALEELEEPEGGAYPAAPDEAAASTGNDAASAASQIEFSPLPEAETPEKGEDPLEELEIVSPFATMLSPFTGESDEEDPDGEDETRNFNPGRREYATAYAYPEMLDANYYPSLVYKPFMDGGSGNLPALELYMPEIIVERDGISYINAELREPDLEEPLNRDFKDLIDSVLGRD
jgi:hypothetical protein